MARIALALLLPLGLVSGVLAGPPDEKLKKEYFRFAKLYSMRCGQFTESQQHDRDAVKRAEAVHALKLTNPLLKDAAAGFDGIALAYTMARKGWDHEPFTAEDKKRLIRQTFVAEIKDDNNARADIIGEALSGVLKKEALDAAMIRLYTKARERHAASWKKLLPLAKQCADATVLKNGIAFNFYVLPRSKFREIHLENVSDKTLTNLTITFESNASTFFVDDVKRSYLFLEELKPGNMVKLEDGLVDKFPYGQAPPRVRDCLTYSLWSDQGIQEDVVLQMTGKNAHKAPGGTGTLVYRFTRQQGPVKNGEAKGKNRPPTKQERLAEADLRYAKKLLKDDATEAKGKQRLKDIVKDYPATKAAEEARQLLRKLGD